MRLFGLTFGVKKSADDLAQSEESGGGWWPVIREGWAGAWQQNITLRRQTLLSFTAVYACITRISSDVGKMPICLKKKLPSGIWVDIDRNSPFLPVLRKPNDFQSRSQFIQQWLISKLIAGNTYILKVRDSRGVVTKLYILDPTRVRPMISPGGDIFYELGRDPLSELLTSVMVAPASEIIHDRMPALFHPLIGTSPIFACGLAAAQGHHIQKSSAGFFKNMAQPSGVLTAPSAISNETATRLKEQWTTNFSGKNVGMVAVLGDNLKFEPLTVSASDSQVIEQLKWSGETVCSAFGVPAFMVGIAPPPPSANIEALTQQYWSQCLQSHIDDIQTSLDYGLGIESANTPEALCVKLDLDALLRMDTATRYKTWRDAIAGGWMTPNEARLKEDMVPVEGGDTCYLQQQNYSLSALAKRDAKPDPFATTPKPASSPPSDGSAADDGTDEQKPGESDEDYAARISGGKSTKKKRKKLLVEQLVKACGSTENMWLALASEEDRANAIN